MFWPSCYIIAKSSINSHKHNGKRTFFEVSAVCKSKTWSGLKEKYLKITLCVQERNKINSVILKCCWKPNFPCIIISVTIREFSTSDPCMHNKHDWIQGDIWLLVKPIFITPNLLASHYCFVLHMVYFIPSCALYMHRHQRYVRKERQKEGERCLWA